MARSKPRKNKTRVGWLRGDRRRREGDGLGAEARCVEPGCGARLGGPQLCGAWRLSYRDMERCMFIFRILTEGVRLGNVGTRSVTRTQVTQTAPFKTVPQDNASVEGEIAESGQGGNRSVNKLLCPWLSPLSLPSQRQTFRNENGNGASVPKLDTIVAQPCGFCHVFRRQ